MKDKLDCNSIIEGNYDPLNRMVTKVYYSDNEYAIYEVQDSNSLCYLTESVKNELSDISLEVDEVQKILTSDKIQEYKHRFAKAYRECFEGNLNNAKVLLNSIEDSFLKEQKDLIQYRYTYIVTACIVLIINLLISIYLLDFNLKLTDTTKDLFFLATFGSIGSLISISINIKNHKSGITKNKLYYFIDALFRIIISMVSAIAILFIIKGNIILGFINGVEYNSEAIFLLAILSGFSEYFVPNLFGIIEEKTITNNE